ncbi:MAG: hypothetical protein NBV68_17950 [Erythrobacter sp.]|uniref:hypothetical protein n=1 Tax=Erythrobacter sp. TaxID=1042 RepID=UPI0025F2BD62|nr:hypothetical protein [Erythrobacter sp.]MCM0001259.1 hypothetical protein [Erythrobacter sp.]
MHRALRLTGWIAGSLVLVAFFFALWASLLVRQAVDDGALSRPVYSCLSRPDVDRLADVSQRAFIRGIQGHLASQRANSTAWHWYGLIANIGARVSFSEAEQVEAMGPMIAALPPCVR